MVAVFHCNLPDPFDTKLEFNCREPSCGALVGEEDAAQLADEDYTVDPNFFDESYTMAGSTGFKVWTGSRLLIETLAWPQSTDAKKLKDIQQCICKGAHLVELGCGVGVVGIYLTSMGAQVLLTDLPTLVENAVDSNLARNEKMITSISQTLSANDNTCPSWLGGNRIRIGKGWASTASLDWTRPVNEQLTTEQSSAVDYIIASDVVFLASMLKSLLNTVDSIFKTSASNNPSFILSFQRRDAQEGEDSSSFTTVKGVIKAIEDRGWSIDCLAWRPVKVRKETDGKVTDDESEVYVFEVKP